MNVFTNEQTKELMEQGKQILSNIADGKTTREIIANIYVENLEDKTLNQGYAMADAIIESVIKFDNDYADACENLDRYIDNFQSKMDEGKSTCERCSYWLKFAASVTAMGDALSLNTKDLKANSDKLLAEIEALNVSEQEATPELEAQLRKKAKEALKSSGIILTGIINQSEMFDELSGGNETAELLIDIGSVEIEYRAIVAMLAYTRVKNGEFESIPVDTPASQITTTVCAQVEQIRIMESVAEGNTTVETASALLSVISTILLTVFAAGFTLLALGGICFIPGTVLPLIGCIGVTVGMLLLFGTHYDKLQEKTQKFIRLTVKGIKKLAGAVASVFAYITEKLIPQSMVISKNISAQIKNTVSGNKTAETNTVVSN